MTRLTRDMVLGIPSSLPALDVELERSTGHTLLALAARTLGSPVEEVENALHSMSATAIPISSGRGTIPGFAEAVAGILRYIGLHATVTEIADVGGMGEAVAAGTDLLFAADDDLFLALRPATNRVVENRWATAMGFAQALAAACESKGRSCAEIEVLILGLGPVGSHAAGALLEMGARVAVFDNDESRLTRCVERHPGVAPVRDLKSALPRYSYVLDATPAPDLIEDGMVCEDSVVCCPGVPHGLTAPARERVGAGFIHDHLALGVAVMAVQCLSMPAAGRGIQRHPTSESQR